VAKYPYPHPYSFKQGKYYPYPMRIRQNCGYPQNIYPRIYILAPVRYDTIYLPLRALKSWRNGQLSL